MKHDSNSQYAEHPVVVEVRDAVLKAARHLSAARMAWVMNNITSGTDWRGCTKGTMAQSLAERLCCGSDRWRAQREPKRPSLGTLYLFRIQENTDRETAALSSDLPRLRKEIAQLETMRDAVQRKLDRKPKWVGLSNEIAAKNHDIARLERIVRGLEGTDG